LVPTARPSTSTTPCTRRTPTRSTSSARVALELTEESALALADAIHKAISHAPAGLASKNQ
jgi:hypothetical protein